MIRNVLEHVGGHITAYPLVSLIIFVSFFTGMLLWVASLSRAHIKHMSQLPLDSESGGTSHE